VISFFLWFFELVRGMRTRIRMSVSRSSLSKEIVSCCREAAERHSVVAEISPDDFIFRFVLKLPRFADTRCAVDYYFDDGARSAEKLAGLISELFGPEAELDLLEFASGYGCVTRHLARAIPKVSVTSCDIHPAAISFIEGRLGGSAILSNTKPELLEPDAAYDVIFALSFFSHMPRASWTRWLVALFSKLKEGGYLIFTTHGVHSLPYCGHPEISSDGFWFMPVSEQGDLDPTEYGITVSLPDFVLGQIRTLPTAARVTTYREAFWWDQQDMYIIQRS